MHFPEWAAEHALQTIRERKEYTARYLFSSAWELRLKKQFKYFGLILHTKV